MNAKANSKTGLIIILLAMSTIISGQGKGDRPSPPSYIAEISKWKSERLTEINGESGWNSLLGLFWLKEGSNTFGGGSANEIVLPKDRAPYLAGTIWLEKGAARLEAKPGSAITHDGSIVTKQVLQSDEAGKPTTLKMGSLTMLIIKRGERYGLRVRDRSHPARRRFAGLDYYPVHMKWRLKAKFEPYDPPKSIPIANVLGMVENMVSPGALVFEMDGKTYRLDPVLEKGSTKLFLIFADRTNGRYTYGAGRYLYAEPTGDDGHVVLDFNKAHNPPCAFTKFATCPLPPRQNRLGVRIEAGEKKYAGSEH